VKISRENPLQIKYSNSRNLFSHSLVLCQHLQPPFPKFIGFLSHSSFPVTKVSAFSSLPCWLTSFCPFYYSFLCWKQGIIQLFLSFLLFLMLSPIYISYFSFCLYHATCVLYKERVAPCHSNVV